MRLQVNYESMKTPRHFTESDSKKKKGGGGGGVSVMNFIELEFYFNKMYV